MRVSLLFFDVINGNRSCAFYWLRFWSYFRVIGAGVAGAIVVYMDNSKYFKSTTQVDQMVAFIFPLSLERSENLP